MRPQFHHQGAPTFVLERRREAAVSSTCRCTLLGRPSEGATVVRVCDFITQEVGGVGLRAMRLPLRAEEPSRGCSSKHAGHGAELT